jgi:hypothetical protein
MSGMQSLEKRVWHSESWKPFYKLQFLCTHYGGKWRSYQSGQWQWQMKESVYQAQGNRWRNYFSKLGYKKACGKKQGFPTVLRCDVRNSAVMFCHRNQKYSHVQLWHMNRPLRSRLWTGISFNVFVILAMQSTALSSTAGSMKHWWWS